MIGMGEFGFQKSSSTVARIFLLKGSSMKQKAILISIVAIGMVSCGEEISQQNLRGTKNSNNEIVRSSGEANPDPSSTFENTIDGSSNGSNSIKSTSTNTDGTENKGKTEEKETTESPFKKYYTPKVVSYSQVLSHPSIVNTSTGLRMTQSQDGSVLTVAFNFDNTSATFRSSCSIKAEERDTGDVIHTFTPSNPEYTWQDVKNFDFNLFMICGTSPKSILVLGTSPGVLIVDAQYIPSAARFSTLNFNPLFVLSKKFPNHDVTKTPVQAALENSEVTANAYCKKMGYRISTFRGSVLPGSFRDRFGSPVDNLMFVANANGDDIVRTPALSSQKWTTSIRCEL